MRIVFVSDTHYTPVEQPVPDGDVLVHAGDLTYNGTIKQIHEVAKWLASLPHKHKVVIAGNHDFGFESKLKGQEARETLLEAPGVIYLEDSEVTIDGVTFWGSPYSLRYFDWAFQLDSFNAAAHWAKIPEGADVLITHGPPQYILDQTKRGDHVGDPDLTARVRVVKPKVHVFGHIHEAYGILPGGTTFVNASICDARYDHVNAPIVVNL